MPISTYTDAAGDAFRSIGDFASGLVTPSLKLGVTGLARSGKTVFITALVHNLIAGARLPFFDAAAQGRMLRVYLEPQPDDVVPRFEYEKHLADLVADPPRWPESTRRISQLRLTLEYASTRILEAAARPREAAYRHRRLSRRMAARSAAASARLSGVVADRARAEPGGGAQDGAKPWHASLAVVDPPTPADEALAETLSDLFKAYLREARADPHALSTLPPGRFLMPGDLAGSPALTFAPLDAKDGDELPARLAVER